MNYVFYNIKKYMYKLKLDFKPDIGAIVGILSVGCVTQRKRFIFLCYRSGI